jgi:hypothetical protein
MAALQEVRAAHTPDLILFHHLVHLAHQRHY